MSDLFSLYVIDTETTGLNNVHHDIIEISILRLNTGEQITHCVKPINFDTIDSDALRINGHKLADLKHETEYGKETYKDPNKIIIEIENWLMEDTMSSEDRIVIGQNPYFDTYMMQGMWKKCGSAERYPFGRNVMDTKQLSLLIDLCKGERRPYYNLGSLVSDWGVKKEKAHRADADVRMTRDLWLKEFEFFKKLIVK